MNDVAIVVDHQIGERLPTGNFSGIGGKTRYQVVQRDHERDGMRSTPIGPKHETPRAADDFARTIEEERNG